MSSSYTLSVHLPAAPDVVEPRVRDALAAQGFGVLSEIDVQATLAEKIGHSMGAYKILGACNPRLAARAVTADPDIGALLPCNVLVRGTDDGGTDVVAVDPLTMLTLGPDALAEVATEARDLLGEALRMLEDPA